MEARQLSLKSGRNREEVPKLQRFPSDNSFQRLDEYVLAVERAQLGHTRHGMLRNCKVLLNLCNTAVYTASEYALFSTL